MVLKIYHLRTRMASLSMSLVSNAPRIPTIATYWFKDASMEVVIGADSVDTVGSVASSFLDVFQKISV